MKYNPVVKLFSSVGGGPHERVFREFTARNIKAGLSSMLSPEQWRSLFSHGKFGRLFARGLTFCGFPIKAFGEALKSSLCETTGAPLSRPVLIVTTNPFFLPHLLVLTRPIHRCAVVPWLFDMYPDALEAAGIYKPWLTKIMTVANHWMIKNADAVVYVGDVPRENAEKRYGSQPNTWMIPTVASQAEFAEAKPALDKELSDWMQGRVIFSYVGNMGLLHDKDTLEKAIPQFLSELDEEMRNKVGFIFAASGANAAKLESAIGESCKDNVKFIGPLPDEPWADLLVKTDVSLATLDDQAKATSVPSKIYSAIAAASIPLAVMSPDAELSRLIAPSGNDADDAAGIIVPVGEVQKLVDAFHKLMDENQREKYLRQVKRLADENDIVVMTDRWCEIFEKILENDREPLGTLLYHGVKRCFDVAAVSAGLAVIWPIILGTGIAVKKNLGSPILFKQMRPGKDGVPFELMKFRSMANAPENVDASHDGERLSEFGKKIRALSLDELPTLFNVLKGDMSLVGPRPLLMSYLDRYNDHQKKRQWVKPGITGWAQVNGRNALSWNEKFDLDVWYVEHASLMLDLRILFKTVSAVLKRSGINHDNSATMPEFMGNEVTDG